MPDGVEPPAAAHAEEDPARTAAAPNPAGSMPVSSLELAGVTFLGVTNSEVGMTPAQLEALHDAFAEQDPEKAGMMEVSSIAAALSSAGAVSVPPGELALVTRSVDPDGTGRVGFRAFVSVYRALADSDAHAGEQGEAGLSSSPHSPKTTLSARRSYRENGQLTEDEAVLEFLRALEEHRRVCEREGKYLEARTAAMRINDLKVHEESRKREEIRARQMSERLKAERAYAAESSSHASMWEAKEGEYEASVKEQVERLKGVHLEKLIAFKDGVESRAPTRPQYSKELLIQRNLEATLARQGKYIEAQRIKTAADAIEKVELASTLAAYKAEAELRLARLQAQQQQEAQALLQRVSRGREELRKAREGDTQRRDKRYKNVLAELDRVQKMETVHLNAFLSKQTLAGKREYARGTAGSPRPAGCATVVV